MTSTDRDFPRDLHEDSESDSTTRVEQIFLAASRRPPEERDAFLDRACSGDATLEREVRSLLDADGEMNEDFLETSVLSIREPSDDIEHGTVIGVYRIEREIGRGGMGRVYLATRDDDVYHQAVAIKVLKRGLDTDEVIRRFQHERRLLARLDHPHIVRILDGGTTHDGLPYFVMEYVEGEPIDRYCKANGLSVRERLELFRKVCSAVSVAHQNLVVHRDLKPQNILVDPRGEPKLLDFGIAKLLDPGSAALTRVGVRMMTPAYASPEQIADGPITTASDVYSLGRLLHELLTDRRPKPLVTPPVNPLQPGRPKAPTTEPVPPSRSPGGGKHLAGDLDSIVMQALDSDPRRRYSSVERFSDDIGRYLAGLPVRARPATWFYRFWKFVRRNIFAVGLACLAVAVLLAFGVGMAVLRDRAEVERQRAEIERQRAQDVQRVLEDVLRAPDPNVTRASDTSLRVILDESAARIRGDQEIEPAVKADLMHVMGEAYLGLGLYDEAEPLLAESLDLRRTAPGVPAPTLAAHLSDLARARLGQDRFDSSESLLREALDLLRSEALDELSLAKALNNQAVLFKKAGRFDLAESLYWESLGMRLRLGDDEAAIATSRHNLAALLREQGRLAEAEVLYRQSLAARRQLYDADSHEVAAALNSLALLQADRGHLEEAAEMLREVVETRRRIYGTEHVLYANARVNLGFVLRQQGELDEAESLFAEALEIFVAKRGQRHSSVANVLRHQAALRLAQERLDDAERLARRALVMFQESYSAPHWRIAEAESLLGACWLARGRVDEAAPLLRSAYETLKAEKGEPARQTREAAERVDALETALRRGRAGARGDREAPQPDRGDGEQGEDRPFDVPGVGV